MPDCEPQATSDFKYPLKLGRIKLNSIYIDTGNVRLGYSFNVKLIGIEPNAVPLYMAPETKAMAPETKAMAPETKLMAPETKLMAPETKLMAPETK